MGSEPAEIRRISSARPRLSLADVPELWASRASEVTGPAVTGSAVTGSAVTGPAVTGPAGVGALGIEALGTGILPVLPALRELLPRGGLARGSVVTVAEFGLLILALAAGASADGAWCGIVGVPEVGMLAAAGLGLDAEQTLLVPDPGHAWPQVVASLLDGCELVLLRPPAQAPNPGAQVLRRLEATLRRERGVLLAVGDWPGAQVRLRVLTQGWTGLGDGHGRLRACCVQVMADGRGQAAAARTRWLWLPAEDGRVAAAEPADIPAADIPVARRLRVVS